MAGVPRAQPVGTFATRLGVAVLLAACLAAAGMSVLAGRLADSAVRRETVARVTATAAGATADLARSDVARSLTGNPGTGSSGTGSSGTGSAPATTADRTAQLQARLSETLASLVAEPDVLRVTVVDVHGTLLLDRTSASAPAGGPPIAASRLTGIARDGGTTVQDGPGSEQVTVDVPLRLPDRSAAIAVTLDDRAPQQRAGQLWRALGVALMLGAAATAALVFLTGGWRLVHRHERALRAAGTDDLTGLGSRRAFRRDLRVQVEHARRHGVPLTLALIDLNGLEAVHSTVGRRRGDALVASAAGVLHRGTATGGRAAYRVGGDAFALVLPGTGQDEAFTVTDTLRREIALDAAPLTANVGLAAVDPVRCPDPETLLIAADAAVFEARCLGGNRVVGAGDGGTGLRWVATSGVLDHRTS